MNLARATLFLYCLMWDPQDSIITALPNGDFNDYLDRRQKLIAEEDSISFGGKIVLDEVEERANEVLMKYKSEELQKGVRNPESFLPARDFLQARDEMECSQVYRIIRAMPKGSVLHAHHSAMGTREFIQKNVTNREHLYVCDANGRLELRFLNQSEASGKIDFDRNRGQDDYDYDFGYNGNGNDISDAGCQQIGGWQPVKIARERDLTLDARIALALRIGPDAAQNEAHAHSAGGGDGDQAWARFLDIFRFLKPLLSYRPVYEDYLHHLLQQLYNDNVQFAEIRTPFPSLFELDGQRHNHFKFVDISNKVINRFKEDHLDFVGIKWIFSKQRNVNDSIFNEYVAEYRQLKQAYPSLVVGFDLVGQEDKGRPLLDFATTLNALERDFQYFFHAGETDWNHQDVDENLVDALLINNTKRIGHGYALLKHPRLMKLVKERDIAVEISPISNQVLKLVRDLRNHPASAFFAQDLPVVVSNDDPAFWGAVGLSHDFYETFLGIMSSRADLRALKQLAMNSIRYSSLDDQEGRKLDEVWTRLWRKFVRELASNGTFPGPTRPSLYCEV